MPTTELNQGLHAATLCPETRLPWPPSTQKLAARRAAALRAARRIAPQLGPLGVAAAAGNGIVAVCESWPAGPRLPRIAHTLPPIPILLLKKNHNLST